MVSTSRGGATDCLRARRVVGLAGPLARRAAPGLLAGLAGFARFADRAGFARLARRAAFGATRFPTGRLRLFFGVLEGDRLAVVDLARLAMTHPVSA